jgi:gamma-glutamylcyclotransferase
MNTTFDHFAYGSNLSLDRLRKRCPSADPIAIGFVRGRQLRFHKIGQDGTGKADAYWTGDDDDRIWGVVCRCLAVEKQILDRCESLGVGYEEVTVDVHSDAGVVVTYLYQAKSDRIDADLRPAPWYHLHVASGARQHSLPLEYQRMIESYSVQND